MSRFEAMACRSAPWQFFSRRVVLPWALQGIEPVGHVLEIGAGSGAMARELLAEYPSAQMTVTDFDPQMVAAARARLAGFGDRVDVRQADATALPFANATFDAVVSWIMLHHTVEWETALAEAVRVVRPGGSVVGYDLLSSRAFRSLHRSEHRHTRSMDLSQLRGVVGSLPVADAILTPSWAALAVRFHLRRAA